MPTDLEIEQAKAAAAGPLGQQSAKFPLLFAKAIIFGRRPTPKREPRFRSATASLVNLGAGPIAITCSHVLRVFRRYRKCSENVLFQIGNLELDPLAQLIDEDERLDIATLRLSEEQVKALSMGDEIGSCVFQVTEWPSPAISQGEFVAFGGFPGSLRVVSAPDEVEFPSWSSGASEISSVSLNQAVSVFDRESWVKSFGDDSTLSLRALGGMSGGPAFIHRGLHWDFVGIVSEYSPQFDAIFLAAAHSIRMDGTIQHPPI